MVLSIPEMGILKPGMDPFRPGMGPFGPRMGPFRPGNGPFQAWNGPSRTDKKFFLSDFFSFFDNLGPFEKIVGQIRLVFDFG